MKNMSDSTSAENRTKGVKVFLKAMGLLFGGMLSLLMTLDVVYPGWGNGDSSLSSNWELVGPAAFLTWVLWLVTHPRRVTTPPKEVIATSPMEPTTSDRTPPMTLVDSPNADERLLTRTCPECGETILSVARKCKHCHSALAPELEKARLVTIQESNALRTPVTPEVAVAVFIAFFWVVMVIVSYLGNEQEKTTAAVQLNQKAQPSQLVSCDSLALSKYGPYSDADTRRIWGAFAKQDGRCQ
jgi:hypothetical protein